MKKIGIFYGSETGTTAGIAARIASQLGVGSSDVHNVAGLSPTVLAVYDVLIFGASTWGAGDIQHDWYDFIAGAQVLDLKDKQMAFFGCGDETMSDTFCDAVGELYDAMLPTGAKMIGEFDAIGYDFTASKARRNGHIVGLLLDEVNHPSISDTRIKAWTDKIKSQI